MTSLSVIIPTYNRARYVVEAITSVIQQRHKHTEIIIIDDGSTDSTAQSIKAFGSQCQYIYQTNQGPAAARNKGLSVAQGKLIAFLDSDDLWLSGKLHKELQLFQQYPEIEMLAGNAAFYLENQLKMESIFNHRGIHFTDSKPRPFDWSLPIMTLGPVCNTSAMIFKREVFDKVGQPTFDESLRLDEDWDLEFRLFSNCNALLYPDVFCHMRTFDDGTRPYSAWGKQKTNAEQQYIWQSQAMILGRYITCQKWDNDTKQRFTQRKNELLSLIEKPKHSECAEAMSLADKLRLKTSLRFS